MLKPIQISASAPIMPSMRVSTSVALSNRRMADSFGAALVALGAAEVMLPPDLVALRCPRIRRGRRYNRKPRRFTNGAAFFVSLNAGAVNSAAELHRARLHVRNGGHLLAVRERHRRLARDLAEVARVLPDRNRLRAERDSIDRRVIAVLA